MKRKPNPELIDEENPEWTDEDFARARPAREVLPEILGPKLASELLKRRPGQRGPGRHPTKVPTTLRLSPEVVAFFKAQGRGWQTRLNQALEEWVAAHRGR
jgi:uncharacterized protein (DUF4415 family)